MKLLRQIKLLETQCQQGFQLTEKKKECLFNIPLTKYPVRESNPSLPRERGLS